MIKEIKKDFKRRGIISACYIQRKFKLNFDCAVKMLEEISIKKDRKTYSEGFLIRIKK